MSLRTLSKSEKIMIVLSITWETFIYLYLEKDYRQFPHKQFILYSSPVFFYWSSVWIWGQDIIYNKIQKFIPKSLLTDLMDYSFSDKQSVNKTTSQISKVKNTNQPHSQIISENIKKIDSNSLYPKVPRNKKTKIMYILVLFILVIFTKTFVGYSTKRTITKIVNNSVSDQNIEQYMLDIERKVQNINTTDKLKKAFKDTEAGNIGVAMGYFSIPEVITTFCKPTGYIPREYIRKIEHQKNELQPDIDMKNLFLSLGATNKQASLMLQKMKEIHQKQLLHFIKKDFEMAALKDNTLTKKDYCEFYDTAADEIAATGRKDIKSKAPKAYQKYFIE